MFLRKLRVHKDGKEHSYWSLVETVRTAGGPRQRTLCYLGELNGAAHARWQKTVEVFNEHGESTDKSGGDRQTNIAWMRRAEETDCVASRYVPGSSPNAGQA
jgi:hypothetical protein